MPAAFRQESWLSLAASILLAAPAALAQGSWPGCTDVTAGEIRVTQIVTRASAQVQEPIKIAFEAVAAPGEDLKDKVHVYFTERSGRLKKFDAVQNRTLTLGRLAGLTIGAQSSDGLMGIALDPAFRTNHRLYLYYTAGSGSAATWRVSRFTLNAAHDALDLASETIVLDIPITLGAQHPGGALQFDAYGDLWITTGDNNLPSGSGFNVHTAANTNERPAREDPPHPPPAGPRRLRRARR
jgi:glucose/arabinose dehydrogenase